MEEPGVIYFREWLGTPLPLGEIIILIIDALLVIVILSHQEKVKLCSLDSV